MWNMQNNSYSIQTQCNVSTVRTLKSAWRNSEWCLVAVKDTYDADTDGGGDGMTVKMSTSSSSSSVQSNEQCSYTLETMTPDLVQTG